MSLMFLPDDIINHNHKCHYLYSLNFAVCLLFMLSVGHI